MTHRKLRRQAFFHRGLYCGRPVWIYPPSSYCQWPLILTHLRSEPLELDDYQSETLVRQTAHRPDLIPRFSAYRVVQISATTSKGIPRLLSAMIKKPKE